MRTRSLRICLISDDFPGEKGCGGIGAYTHALARGLAELGHRVHVVTRDWGDGSKVEIAGVQVHRLWVPTSSRSGMGLVSTRFWETWQVLLWNLRVNQVIRRISSQEGLDVIESPEYRAQGLLASFTQRRVPMVVRLHGGANYSRITFGLPMGWSQWDTRVSDYLERKMARRADCVVSASKKLSEWCAKHWKIDARAIRTIPLPVDEKLFRQIERVDSNPPTLLYVGRISSIKGVDTVIEALPAIIKAEPATRIRLVGQEERGHPAIERFRQRLREANVPASSVEFLGSVRRNALPALYGSAAICLVPSPGGSSGYTCLEAMASGCVVVAASSDYDHGVITDNVDGLLFPPGSASALSKAVTELLLDPPRRRRLSLRAVETVRDRFSSYVVSAETADVYRSLLA